ncbi:MAG: hypothetical protein RBT78_06625 [Kiritimatiellia bacterium]|jgi:hypothetical protein|nr:hypothetical protein [Kiritimatiellia bacterium]
MRPKRIRKAGLMALAGWTLAVAAQTETWSERQIAAWEARLPVLAGAAEGAMASHLNALRRPGAPSRAVVHAVRVAEALAPHPAAARQAAAVWYAVPALSDRIRLPDTYPSDGSVLGEIRITAAGDEYEPASFVVYPFRDLGKTRFAVSALKNARGQTVAAEQLDLKVVKVWYQNRNGWFSYFSDTGLDLLPELLLHDEDLVKVDTVARANYARLRKPEGEIHQWISPPKVIDSSFDGDYRRYTSFRPMSEPSFRDAETLQPVALPAGAFKQFWLTARVNAGTPAGLYRGTITATAADGQVIATIPVALNVLPFELPQPKAYFDPERDFLVTLYNYVNFEILMDDNGMDRALAEKQFLAILRNMARHNMTIYKMRDDIGPDVRRILELMKEAGMRTDPLIGCRLIAGGPSYDGVRKTRRAARERVRFFEETVGHTNVFLQSGDEPGASWIVKMRPDWKVYHEAGLRFFTAGHGSLYHKAGYLYDMHPAAGFPEEQEHTRKWNEIGHAYVGWYAGQHVGSENPAYARRQNGLAAYFANFSMIMNYAFSVGPWNDLAKDTYKPMVYAYATRDGLVDTLAWEGFREGVDDIRYATLLQRLARRAAASPQVSAVYAGRKALQYLASFDGLSADLNAARAEMIARILELQALE